MQQRRKVVVMSRSQAKELVKDYRLLVGKNVKLGDLSFKVVGIYKDDETRQNNEAFTSFYTVKTIYAKGDKAGDIEFTLKNMKSVEDNRAFEKIIVPASTRTIRQLLMTSEVYGCGIAIWTIYR